MSSTLDRVLKLSPTALRVLVYVGYNLIPKRLTVKLYADFLHEAIRCKSKKTIYNAIRQLIAEDILIKDATEDNLYHVDKDIYDNMLNRFVRN